MASDASDALQGHIVLSSLSLYAYLFRYVNRLLINYLRSLSFVCEIAVRKKVQLFLNAARTGSIDLLKSMYVLRFCVMLCCVPLLHCMLLLLCFWFCRGCVAAGRGKGFGEIRGSYKGREQARSTAFCRA